MIGQYWHWDPRIIKNTIQCFQLLSIYQSKFYDRDDDIKSFTVKLYLPQKKTLSAVDDLPWVCYQGPITLAIAVY